jgi:hypothetical protein
MDITFWWQNMMVRERSEGLGVHGKIILKWIKNRAQDRDQWQFVVNMVMNSGSMHGVK